MQHSPSLCVLVLRCVGRFLLTHTNIVVLTHNSVES